ncbi:hypothetical protein OG601_47405 [Streptomyces sp. NBC_01239]|uniref:hypothetical protein n=1 Tax=Streptomyces sp. NBC_01239 TaxID=2903792 RepID=UPI002258BF65|nr:hypothetical protein [Streptomyces sp. NBC_01239]MCX4816755.1 hypothetical protein [Streptomyces sp. NBC_01239]MCX4818203.1 hypothetical protein [Streptomyces sp. NBC_01239]
MDLHAWITQQVDHVECLIEENEWPPSQAEGVRLRCEADRRILARHTLDPARADSWMFAAACMGCGTEGTFEEPVAENINDCPELLDLAHAHGITPEILAGLDRPQAPEPKPIDPGRYANGGILTPPITTSDVPEALRGPRWKP